MRFYTTVGNHFKQMELMNLTVTQKLKQAHPSVLTIYVQYVEKKKKDFE